MFEYEDGLLVVDDFFYHPSYPNGMIVKIQEDYYTINNAAMGEKPIKESDLRHLKKKIIKNSERETQEYEYIMAGVIPRKGFTVELGRPITAKEFKDICKKYNLTTDDISKEFDNNKGGACGEKYIKYFKSIQIRVPNGEAIPLEKELRERGIEVGNGAPGRVDIRTDWGGYREGAGRKPTGRKIARIYVTDEEEKKLREYLKEIRKDEE